MLWLSGSQSCSEIPCCTLCQTQIRAVLFHLVLTRFVVALTQSVNAFPKAPLHMSLQISRKHVTSLLVTCSLCRYPGILILLWICGLAGWLSCVCVLAGQFACLDSQCRCAPSPLSPVLLTLIALLRVGDWLLFLVTFFLSVLSLAHFLSPPCMCTR